MDDVKCERCGGSLEAGFAAVTLDGTATPLFWVPGDLEREPITGGADLADPEKHPIRAFRCTRCSAVSFRV